MEPPDMPAPAKASSVEQVRIGSRQIDCGLGSESQTITEALISGVKPRKADDLYSWVVPVLPAAVQLQPAAEDAAFAVPPAAKSPSMATDSVRASSAGTASWQGTLSQVTNLPLRSVMVPTGVGGHHHRPQRQVRHLGQGALPGGGSGRTGTDAVRGHGG